MRSVNISETSGNFEKFTHDTESHWEVSFIQFEAKNISNIPTPLGTVVYIYMVKISVYLGTNKINQNSYTRGIRL